MAWTNPRTWTAGEFVEAADMNAEIRDNLNAIVPLGPDAWTTYTPTWTQSATIAKTVARARYTRTGRLVTVVVAMAATSAGTVGNAIAVGLPVAAAFTNIACGTFRLYDASANGHHIGIVFVATSTTVQFLSASATTAAPGFMGTAASPFNIAVASGDGIDLVLTYEAAS